MNKIKLTKVAKTLMFEVDKTVLENLAIEYDILNKKIYQLKQIDVSNVKPLVYIDETPLEFLRKDDPEPGLSSEIVIKNAPLSQNNFVILPKVVKDV